MSLAKKLSSIFLSFVLVTGLLPYSAYADSVSGATNFQRWFKVKRRSSS